MSLNLTPELFLNRITFEDDAIFKMLNRHTEDTLNTFEEDEAEDQENIDSASTCDLTLSSQSSGLSIFSRSSGFSSQPISRTCCICISYPAVVCLVPCGHTAYCASCWETNKIIPNLSCPIVGCTNKTVSTGILPQ